MDSFRLARPAQKRWQDAADLIRSHLKVNIALISRVSTKRQHPMMISSGEEIALDIEDSLPRDERSLCERTLSSHSMLCVENTEGLELPPECRSLLGDCGAFMGGRINWPGGRAFGTFFAISRKPRAFSESEKKLMPLFRHVFESDLAVIERERNLALQSQLLSEAEKKYATLADDARIGILLLADDTINFMNRYLADLLGFSEEEQIGESLLQRLAPEDRKPVEQTLEAVRRHDQSIEPIRVRVLTREGQERSMLFHCSRVIWEEQTMVQVYLLDITEKRQLEQQRDEDRAMMETLIEQIPAPIFAKDASDFRFVLWNKRIETLIGIPASEAVGKTNAELLTVKEEAERLRRDDESVLKTGTTLDVEETITSRSGKPLILHTIKTLVSSPRSGRKLILGLAADVTALRQSQRELRESEAKFRSIFEFAPVGLVIVDTEGRASLCNPMLANMLGLPQKEVEKISYHAVTHEDDIATTRNAYTAVFQRGRKVVDFTKRYIRPDGKVVWAEIRLSAIPDRDGAPKHALAIIQDISHRRNLEARMVQSQRLEAVGQLAGGIAHDFNNLLHVIIGYAEMLQREHLKDDAQEDIEVLMDAAERGVGLVQQLISFSRSEEIRPSRINLNDLITRTTKLLKRVIGENLELHVSLAEDLAPIEADPSQISQVLLNLCVNARDAIEKTGNITITTKNTFLDGLEAGVGLPPGDYVVITVKDDGAGIAPEVKDHLFDAFVTTKGAGVGTGLGLATVFGIVQRHKGSISVESQPEKGAEFTIYLPACSAEPPRIQTRETEAEHEAKGQNELILVAEDDPLVVDLATSTLEHNGYKAISADNGEKALELVKAIKGDIAAIMLDVVMPGMSGPDVYQSLRDTGCQVPVLFCSGYNDDAASQFDDPLTATLKKPYGQHELLTALKSLLKR